MKNKQYIYSIVVIVVSINVLPIVYNFPEYSLIKELGPSYSFEQTEIRTCLRCLLTAHTKRDIISFMEIKIYRTSGKRLNSYTSLIIELSNI